MKNRKRIIAGIVLAILALGIHVFSLSAPRAEQLYAIQSYPFLSEKLRFLTGWFPVSLGDLLYGLAAVWLIWKLARGIQTIVLRKVHPGMIWTKLLKLTILVLIIYIVFNVFWGINYNRQGIAHQLGLQTKSYTTVELKELNALLLEKTVAEKSILIKDSSRLFTDEQVFEETQRAYASLAKTYPFLYYQRSSLKPSLWGWLGNYVGFAGYYNPFTGEAQVNTTMPKFLQPFTTCHEVAHQLGYAKENEANFVGYLAASQSDQPVFRYSVYLDLFIYANRNLWNVDSAAAKSFARALSPEIKADLKTWKEFTQKHKNPIEPAIRWLYGKYLQTNQQPTGVLSYDEVTEYLVTYYKKFGRI